MNTTAKHTASHAKRDAGRPIGYERNPVPQSLSEQAFWVFMQTWYMDEVLYRVITQRTHALEHITWRREFQKSLFNGLCESTKKEWMPLEKNPGWAYDVESGDEWTTYGRKRRDDNQGLIARCKRRLADSTHGITPAPLQKASSHCPHGQPTRMKKI